MKNRKLHLWLIRFIGLIVPQRLRADWRQEWEAELRYREAILAEWDNKLNAQVSIESPTTLDDEVKSTMAVARMASTLTSLFSLTALLLAAIGLYGVMSYAISRRTHEIGIRMALGAPQRSVLRLVLQQGLWLTGIGIGVGLTAAVFRTRLLQSLLYGVGVTDPLTFAGVALLLAAVALLACWIPARRATKVDPMIALRCE